MRLLITLDREDIKKILKGSTVELDLDISTYMNIPVKNTILVEED